MLLNCAKISCCQRKQPLKTVAETKKVKFISFLQKVFFLLVLLVSTAKFLEVYDKTKKKFTKLLLHIKIGGKRVTGYTFRVGYYIYFANCNMYVLLRL
jgi:hypothetical protein